jgi:pyridoxal 5'-phosphate synthase pdxT subunit
LVSTEAVARRVGSAGASPRVGVLALQGAVRPHLAALTTLGVTPVEVRTPEQLAGVEAMVLPGGESTTMSKLLDTSGLREPLAERLVDGMPALGTCAGMILLAREVRDGRPDQRSLGVIDIAVRRNAFGRQVDSFEADLAVAGDEVPLHAVFIRAPVIEEAGPGVDVLASVRDRPVLARQGPVIVASFHPELTDDLRLHQLLLSEI